MWELKKKFTVKFKDKKPASELEIPEMQPGEDKYEYQ